MSSTTTYPAIPAPPPVNALSEIERNTRQTRNAVRFLAWLLGIVYALSMIGGIVIWVHISDAINAVNSPNSTNATSATLTAATAPVGNGITVKATGHNAFTYDDPVFGQVKVNETEHPGFDTVGATFLDGLPAGMSPGQAGTVEWYSDFSSGPHAGQYGTLTYTINTDGSGYSGTVAYPAG